MTMVQLCMSMATLWHRLQGGNMLTLTTSEYTIEYTKQRICIIKDNMFCEIIGADKVLAFCDATDDLDDYNAIDTYFETN